MEAGLRVLLIDDDPDDHLLTRDLLREAFGPGVELEWASSYDAGLAALNRSEFDVCLLDYRLGAKTGLDLLGEAPAAQIETPIILLTGEGQREIDLQAMQAGAADYLTKDLLQPGLLERAIRHALERHRDRRALRQLNDLLENRVEQRTRELEAANQALQQADRRKDEFLAVLAHELRNPLAPIMNSLQLLEHAPNDDALGAQAREVMDRQLRQLVRLTDDLFEVSRISRGKIELRKERIDLRKAIEQAVEASQPLYAARNQELTVELPGGPVMVKADPARLAQVVGNLLNNAMKFTPPKGRIGLTLTTDEAQAVVCVRDDGIGIAPAEIGRIFEMFAQVSPMMQRSETGLGIGLTLVQNLVEMHGGSISATSRGLGYGSEFVVRLPLEAAAPVRPSQPKTPAGAAQIKRRLLIVDDNRDAATSLAQLLQVSGHETATAFSGLAALEVAAQYRPEIVLLDIGLPDIDGLETAKRLRSRFAGRPLTIVALTGWGQESDRQKSKAAGFDHHLLKPVEFSELMKIIGASPASR